jgi:hypothetical protein
LGTIPQHPNLGRCFKRRAGMRMNGSFNLILDEISIWAIPAVIAITFHERRMARRLDLPLPEAPTATIWNISRERTAEFETGGQYSKIMVESVSPRSFNQGYVSYFLRLCKIKGLQ